MSEYTESGSNGEGPVEPFDDTIRFLYLMRHDRRCVLSAICPNGGGIETRTFDLDEPGLIRAWLSKWNGKRNLHWVPNTMKGEADPDKKPGEVDIKSMDMLHVDIDPRKGADWIEERQRIRYAIEGFDPSPSAIVDSGNGFQCFWLLVPEDRLFVDGHPEIIANAKLYNVALRDQLDGDNCQSLDHLMRLPGTRNLPDKNKRAAGRVERTSSVVKWPDA